MIDVIIPAYNAEKFILDAIKSVEVQTYPAHMIFVVNDGSTDTTGEIVTTYSKQSRVPIIYISKENGGPNSARNAGLTHSQADFVAFLDADDTWESTKLQEQINIFNNTKFPNLGLVYSHYNQINSYGKVQEDAYIVPVDPLIKGHAFVPLLTGNKILGSASSVLIKRSVFDTVGFFDETLRFGEDWDMWLRIAEKYEIDFSPSVLVHVRRHQANQTNALDNVLLGEIKFFNKWTEKLKGGHEIPSRWADQIAFHMIIRIFRLGFIKKTLTTLSSSAKRQIFKRTFGSPYVYVIYFCLKKLFSPGDWSHLLKKLKRYA